MLVKSLHQFIDTSMANDPIMTMPKPMIIVSLILTSALVGCIGTDGTEGIQGPQGETGEQGPPGVQGPQGETGPAGPNGADGTDGIDADESRIAELEAELLDKEAKIVILLGNISEMEEDLISMDIMMETYYTMIVQMQSQITILQASLEESINQSRAMNDFSYLNFQGIQLHNFNNGLGVQMDSPIFDFANLVNSSLSYSNFSDASFVNANLASADGLFSTFHNTDFSGAAMYNGIWRQSDFSNAIFVQSNLAYTEFRWSDLSGANLSGAVMYGGSNWMGVNLSYANLTNAWMYDVDLRGADLTGADLTGARLSYLNPSYGAADITGVTWDWAICPDGTAAYYHGQTCVNNL